MSYPTNTDPTMPWNDPVYRDDPAAPHNDPAYRDDPTKPWNDRGSSERDLDDRDADYYRR